MIEFIQTNGVPLLILLFMLVVIAIGLRGGGESSCGMAMHQQMNQPPTNAGREHRPNVTSLDPVGAGSAATPAAPSEAQHPKESPSLQTPSIRRTN